MEPFSLKICKHLKNPRNKSLTRFDCDFGFNLGLCSMVLGSFWGPTSITNRAKRVFGMKNVTNRQTLQNHCVYYVCLRFRLTTNTQNKNTFYQIQSQNVKLNLPEIAHEMNVVAGRTNVKHDEKTVVIKTQETSEQFYIRFIIQLRSH